MTRYRILRNGIAAFAATFFIFVSGNAMAAACYENRVQPGYSTCNTGGGHNSADFSGGCSIVPDTIIKVPIPCTPVWINSAPGPTHAAACAAVGKVPSTIGGRTCQSWELRNNMSGSSITTYSQWGKKCVGGGSTKDGYRAPKCTEETHYCWHPTQKKDYDQTDKVDQYACQ